MPYQTPWGETRPTKKEIREASTMAAHLAGVDPASLKQSFEPGQWVHTPAGEAQVVSMTGSLFVHVAIDGGRIEQTYPITKVRPKE